jgi:hypothetical protein
MGQEAVAFVAVGTDGLSAPVCFLFTRRWFPGMVLLIVNSKQEPLMKKRSVGLMLLAIVLACPAFSEPPPAAYKEAVQRQLNNRFNENDIVFKFRQRWGLADSPGKQPLLQTCLVEAAN